MKKIKLGLVVLVLSLVMTGLLPAHGSQLMEEDEILELKERLNNPKDAYQGLGKGKNLLVLQIDSLQNFVIDRSYQGQEITPNLNRLKEEAIYFENYYELIGKGDSGDAEFVSNNSLYPDRDNIAYEIYGDNNFYGLGHYMRQAGYKNYLVTSNIASRFSRDRAYKNQGFDHFLSLKDFKKEDRINYSISDQSFFKQLLGKLGQLEDENFYMYVSNSSSQKPYALPKELGQLEIAEEDQSSALADYLQTMNYLDRELGNFIQGLKDLGLYEKTVLVIQGSSHGISTETPETKRLMDRFLDKDYNYRDMLNLPLMVRIPGQPGEKIKTLGSHLDFYPTMANIMDGQEFDSLAFGVDLLNFQGYRPVSLDRYLPKSFLDKSMIFEMSNKGYFDLGQARDFESKRTLDINLLRDEYQALNQDIKRSKYIMDRNIMKEVIDLRQDLAKDQGRDKLIRIDGISSQDLDVVYNEGHNYLAFKMENYKNLSQDLKNYSDLNYLIEVEEKDLEELAQYSQELGQDSEIAIKSSKLYQPVRDLGFDKIILDAKLTEADISKGYLGLILKKEDLKTQLYNDIKDHYRIMLDYREAPISSKLYKQKIDTEILDYYQVLNTLVSRKFRNKHIVAHAGGEIMGQSYTNSLDAVELSYSKGVRLVEIDFEWTLDDQLVATHSWDGFIGKFFQVPVRQYSYQEFEDFTMINNWTQLTPERLERWFNQYPEVYLVTDIKDRNIEALRKLRDENPFLTDKIIPQVYNFEEYLEAEKLGFKNIILTLYKINAHNDDIVKFAEKKRPFAITMSKNRSRTGLPERLKKIGIYSYSHTINDLDEVEELEDLGIMGIYTDRIRP